MKRIQKYKKISKYWNIYNNQKNKLKLLINQKGVNVNNDNRRSNTKTKRICIK